MYTNIYRYAFSTRENVRNASVQKKAPRDGILIQMVDGPQQIYRMRSGHFYCPYPDCRVRMSNSLLFQVRSESSF